MSDQHWHYGHNVSGYLPESDTGTADTFDDAKSGLDGDLEHELGCLGYAPDGSEADTEYASLEQAQAELKTADGVEFLAYTSDGGEHRIPTAWWISPCGEADCEAYAEWAAEQ